MKKHITYQKPKATTWSGRTSKNKLYLHEKIDLCDLTTNDFYDEYTDAYGLLSYACDEGVARNQGRIGAVKGGDMIKTKLGTLANHFSKSTRLFDFGAIHCMNNDLETCQQITASAIAEILSKKCKPIVLGGGHDLAYAHYTALHNTFPDKKIGIINLDAHLDLREPVDCPHSGTPFYQIAHEFDHFAYCCLGVQKASNHHELFKSANQLGVHYLFAEDYTIQNTQQVFELLHNFMQMVDGIYLTIDLDGFSSAIAPGVSAPSPFGFQLDIVLKTLHWICQTKKLWSVDVVEYNPKYDQDGCTARLAAQLTHYLMGIWK